MGEEEWQRALVEAGQGRRVQQPGQPPAAAREQPVEAVVASLGSTGVGPESGSSLRLLQGFSVELLGRLAKSGPTL